MEADQMIAHIRLATRGTLEYENTHPFVKRDWSGRTWTLAHNGTIFESQALNPYVHSQKGQTDSERILLYAVDRINGEEQKKGRTLSQEERFAVIEAVIKEITPENKVNLLLFDGELMYVHTNYRDSLHFLRKETAVFVSTRPLDKGNWEKAPMNTLLAFEAGKWKYTGNPHENEFFDSEEKMRMLFLDYAGL